MEDLLKKVIRVLQRHFPGATTELELLGDEHRLSGFLYWSGFEGLEQIDRQRKVWEILRSGLTADERRHVSAVLTLTPDEIAAIREG